jgi:single-strand DNA-binding protein
VAEGLNEVTLIGNLGKDPERAKVSWPLLRFNLGVTESRPAGQGKWKDKTQWFRVIVRGNRVDYFEKKLRKGDTVAVKGRISIRSYDDRNGRKQWMTEIEVTHKLLILKKGRAHEEDPRAEEQRSERRREPAPGEEARPEDGEQSGFIEADALEEGAPEDYDDDLPF